jgi:hypothetical protein
LVVKGSVVVKDRLRYIESRKSFCFCSKSVPVRCLVFVVRRAATPPSLVLLTLSTQFDDAVLVVGGGGGVRGGVVGRRRVSTSTSRGNSENTFYVRPKTVFNYVMKNTFYTYKHKQWNGERACEPHTLNTKPFSVNTKP